MTHSTFTFHYDSGHAWLAVNYKDMKAAGLEPKDFSSFSYYQGVTYFLEEDCDATTFARAWEARFGYPSIKEVDDGDRSPIREMLRNTARDEQDDGDWITF